MASSDNPIQEVIDEEIRRKKRILEEMHRQIYTRVVQLRLQPGETVSRIRQIDGVIVEFEKKK